MKPKKNKLQELREHEWVPRDTENEPRVCPKCKSPYWNRPRKDATKKAAKTNQPSKGTQKNA